MQNRIKNVLASGIGPTTAQRLAEIVDCDLQTLNYLIVNPDVEPPIQLAQNIADCYNVELEFILGHPINYERKLNCIEPDFQSDLRKMTNKDEKVYWEYIWRKGYFRPSNIPNKGKAFIAMSFNSKKFPELADIRNAFKEGIKQAGYIPIVADELHSNNDINFEILKAIDESAFLVLDTTYENYGAYYEAGYAKGSKKGVIICCKESKFKAASDHFDINHINHVLWENTEDLVTKLTERILKTIG